MSSSLCSRPVHWADESHQLRIRELLNQLPQEYRHYPSLMRIALDRVNRAATALSEFPQFGQAQLSETGELFQRFLDDFGSDPAHWPHWTRRHSCG